ncbi:MAG: DUF4127 family protein [Brevinema sp.]
MKIVAIPLDKRSYNYSFLQSFSALKEDIHLILPKPEDLGYRKESANLPNLEKFLFEQIDVDAFVISAEMLIYGGLFSSRIHYSSMEQLKQELEIFPRLKAQFPHARIYVSNLIMRNPSYSSSEEEPDYYQIHGADIFRWGFLKDQLNQEPDNLQIYQEWQTLDTSIHKPSLEDYLQRRRINLEITRSIIDLTKDHFIDILFIPRDDTAEFGLGSMDRKNIQMLIQDIPSIYSHPGTDEAMCTLMTRAYTDFHHNTPKIYPIFSNSKDFIPKYEDIPFSQSLVSQIGLIGGCLTDHMEDADIVLAIHSPYDLMQEACDQEFSPSHKESLIPFFQELKSCPKSFILTDVAYANGGDSELIQLLDEYLLLEKCCAYAAWNTTGNTLGTNLCQAVFTMNSYDKQKATTNLIERLLSDWIYQAIVRWEIQKNVLPTLGAEYSQFNGKDQEILQIINTKTIQEWKKRIKFSFSHARLEDLKISAPFGRMSGLDFQLSKDI